MIFGLYKSVFGLVIITASTFAASAVRNRAPILPGFSGASATKISGLSDYRLMPLKSKDLALAISNKPSVVSRCASFW